MVGAEAIEETDEGDSVLERGDIVAGVPLESNVSTMQGEVGIRAEGIARGGREGTELSPE